MVLLLIISLFNNFKSYFSQQQTETVESILKENEIKRLNKIIESYFISNTNLTYRVDSLEKKSKAIEPERKIVKKKWRDAIAESPVDSTTKKLDQIHTESETLCDSMIALKDEIIETQDQIISNDSNIIASNDSVKSMMSDIIVDQDKKNKKQQRKIILHKTLNIVLTTALIISLII